MNNIKNDEAVRRSYWTEKMELAYDFMQKMLEYPVTECGEAMVSVRQAVKNAHLTVKFADTKIGTKYDRVFYLREGLIKKFLAVAKEVNDLGCFLKVEDCFRTPNMQHYSGLRECVFDVILKKTIWENDGNIPSSELMLRRFTGFVATSAKTCTHISGSAIDVSVYQTCNLSELDRGGSYLEMSELTFMDSPFITEKAAENRSKIRGILQKHGFVAYPFEFWHFSQGDIYAEHLSNSGRAARYGAVNFDLANGKIIPVENPGNLLFTKEEVQEKIEAALVRLK